MEFSVRHPSPPNTYSYVREEGLGSTRKFVENHLLFTCITNQILALCTIQRSVDGLEKLSGKKVPPAHVQRVYLEEPIGLPCPHRINFSVCLSVCLFVCSSVCLSVIYENTLNFHVGIKSGCPRGVFCPSSIPSEYLFLCTRRKFGFNKKIRTKSLIVYVYYQPNSCTMYHTPAEL